MKKCLICGKNTDETFMIKNKRRPICKSCTNLIAATRVFQLTCEDSFLDLDSCSKCSSVSKAEKK